MGESSFISFDLKKKKDNNRLQIMRKEIKNCKEKIWHKRRNEWKLEEENKTYWEKKENKDPKRKK